MGWKIKKLRISIKPPRIHLPNIPKLPRIPNPIDVATGAARAAGKLGEKVAKEAGRAIDNTLALPKKTVHELERDLDRITKGLDDARMRIKREGGGALNLIADAVKAAAKFTEAETRGTLDTFEGALHRRNIISSIWYLATNPIKTTNKNAMQASQDSALLAAAAQIAATAYGGPAGAAAYAAWMAYNLTGGDINAALRAGVTTGLIAAATGAIASMPSGAEKLAAEVALKAAIAKAQGKSSEEISQVALASLIQAGTAQLTFSLNAADLDQVQKGIVSGALGGAAVAASGGNSKDVREAFLKSGGEVLVQGAQAKLGEIAGTAKDAANDFLTSAIEKEDLEAARRTYEEAKNAINDAEAILEEGKRALKDVTAEARKAAEEARTAIMKARAEVQAQVDRAKATVIQVREELETRAKAVQETAITAYAAISSECEKEVAAGKRAVDVIKADADAEIQKINVKTNEALAILNREQADAIAAADKVAGEGLRMLEETRLDAINELLTLDGGKPARALSNNWILSWDPAKLKAGAADGIGVVLTYAGADSAVDAQLDAIENPPEP